MKFIAIFFAIRLYGAIQALAVVIIISILMLLALENYKIAIHKSNLSEAFVNIHQLKYELALHYAIYGNWSLPDDGKNISKVINPEFSIVKQVNFYNGSFLLNIDLKNINYKHKLLAFKLSQSVSGAPLLWKCTSRLHDFPDVTDIQQNDFFSDDLLPSTCRTNHEKY